MNSRIDKRLTIAHTEASDGWGGQEIRILQEARWFRARGDRVVLFAPARSEILRKFRGDGFEAEAIDFEKGKQWLDFIRLAWTFRRLKPDVLGTHSRADSWVGLLAGKIARVPVLLRYRHISAPVGKHLLNQWLYGALCDHVVTTAECIRREILGKFKLPDGKVTAVPTGIEPPRFATTREEARLSLCRELRLPEQARFIGCVAVLRSWKGQDDLMTAFDAIAPEFPNHHLVLAGGGPGFESLNRHRENLRSAARILLVGHQEDPWRFFRAFDLAVLASYKDEGIPQSLLQAMFAECPVLGTTVGGIPEIVRDGETGLLAPPRSPKDLADRIAGTLRAQPETASRAERALAFARAEHTLDGMGNRMLSIIRQVRETKG